MIVATLTKCIYHATFRVQDILDIYFNKMKTYLCDKHLLFNINPFYFHNKPIRKIIFLFLLFAEEKSKHSVFISTPHKSIVNDRAGI